MFRSQPYLENTTYIQINLDTPLTFPGNNQYQTKMGYKFTVRDRDNFYDWYNAYFHVDFEFEAVANGANIDADTDQRFFLIDQKFETKISRKKPVRGGQYPQRYFH